MNHLEIAKIEAKKYKPALKLEEVMSMKARKIIAIILVLISACLGYIRFFVFGANEDILGQSLLAGAVVALALAFIYLSQILMFISISGYDFKKSSKTKSQVNQTKNQTNNFQITYDDAEYLLDKKSRSIGEAFVKSSFGIEVLRRSGMDNHSIEILRKSVATESVSATSLVGTDLAFAIINNYRSIGAGVISAGGTIEDIAEAISWTRRSRSTKRMQGRWWLKDNLHRIPSLGHRWLYGATNTLMRYGVPVSRMRGFSTSAKRRNHIMKDVLAIEKALLENNGSNAFVMGKDHETALEAGLAFCSLVLDGIAHEPLRRLFPIYIDVEAFSDCSRLDQFEERLQALFSEASYAGGMIIVVGHFDAILEKGHSLKAEVVPFMEKILSAEQVPIILLSDEAGYHGTIEPHHGLLNHAHKVVCAPRDEKSAQMALEDAVIPVELKTNVIFSVEALRAIVHASASSSDLIKNSVDILYDIGTTAIIKAQDGVVGADLIRELLPNSSASSPRDTFLQNNQETLTNLNDKLKLRILGQDDALKIVTNAIQSAFTGLRDDKKPIASFLAIGPSGVGKTETAKALAEFIFGGQENIVRLDMSEYSANDAVEKLIGSPVYGEAGALSAMLSEKRTGIILLDEFEKTHPKALNVFLQILDEGAYTNGLGDVVSVRDYIIFATSNAGSDLFFAKSAKHDQVHEKVLNKRALIDVIIEQGILSPELLNRFDAIVPYQTLSGQAFRSIVTLATKKAVARIRERGVVIEFSGQVVDAISARIYDERFGAREVERAVREIIEEPVAKALLAGTIRTGAVVDLIPESSAYGANLIIRPKVQAKAQTRV